MRDLSKVPRKNYFFFFGAAFFAFGATFFFGAAFFAFGAAFLIFFFIWKKS